MNYVMDEIGSHDHLRAYSCKSDLTHQLGTNRFYTKLVLIIISNLSEKMWWVFANRWQRTVLLELLSTHHENQLDWNLD